MHWNEDLYDSFEEAAKREDGIIIISVFIKVHPSLYHLDYRHYSRSQSTPIFTSDCSCLSVCLSVCLLARLLKNPYMDLDANVGTWTNLTFEPDPDHSPDAGTEFISPISYRLRNFAALPRLPVSCAATRNFTSGKSHV